MSPQDPKSGRLGGKPKTVPCAEWEALLVDALDGTLSANDAAAFEAHRDTCLACAQLLEEAKRGGEWLHFLEAEPEVPEYLVGRILASTSGIADQAPLAQVVVAGTPAAVVPGWLPGLERHAMQSRWIMTAAMAFFSIAFTLNAAGIRLNGFHLADLKPTAIASSLASQLHFADRQVVRYYDNLRFVYELESRVREMRRDAAPVESKQNGQAAPQSAPDNSVQPKPKKTSGGSAQKTFPAGSQLPPEQHPLGETTGEPVLASLHLESFHQAQLDRAAAVCIHGRMWQSSFEVAGPVVARRTGKQGTGSCTMQRPGAPDSKNILRTERSLA